MNYIAAQKLKIGDKVEAPRAGIMEAVKIEKITEDPDPRCRLLFRLEGYHREYNYKFLTTTTARAER